MLLQVMFLAFLGSIAGLIGGVVFLVREEWGKTLCRYAVPFAAGVLLSVSLLHLLPKSVHEIGELSYSIVLGSLLFSFFFEQYFAHLHHHEHRRESKLQSSVPLVIFGDTIHNFIDGVAIAAAYITNPAFGVVVALATFLHETPHEIGDFGILLSAGWSKGKAFLANLLSASATFPGALMVLFFIKGTSQSLGILLSIAAGMFLYLGASDFLPEVVEERDVMATWKRFVSLIAGVVIMYILTFISPEH